MAHRVVSQSYPRINKPSDKYHGFLDDKKLIQHKKNIRKDDLKKIIRDAIYEANKKSSRAILDVPAKASLIERKKIYINAGSSLFGYFRKYYGDPAATAHGCLNRHYSDIAKEQFRNQTLQKERMNSGWRYQFIAKDAARASGRFITVSDIGTTEADFNVIVGIKNLKKKVNIYVSVKNRVNTMGGQDWRKVVLIEEKSEYIKAAKIRLAKYLVDNSQMKLAI